MNKYYWVISLALVGVLPPPLVSAEPLLTHVDVFTAGKDGYHIYRIPAIETATDGSLIAFAEARKHTIYDAGHGATWHRSAIVPGGKGANESQLVELAAGTILMNSRQAGGSHRWMTTRYDDGQTWSEPRRGMPLTAVACAIERFSIESASDRNIIWTGPKGPHQNNLVIRISYDEAKTFPVERLIYKGEAGYSDLTILKDKTVGVLWECNRYDHITSLG